MLGNGFKRPILDEYLSKQGYSHWMPSYTAPENVGAKLSKVTRSSPLLIRDTFTCDVPVFWVLRPAGAGETPAFVELLQRQGSRQRGGWDRDLGHPLQLGTANGHKPAPCCQSPRRGGSGCLGRAACMGFLQLELLPFEFGFWGSCMRSSFFPSPGSTQCLLLWVLECPISRIPCAM